MMNDSEYRYLYASLFPFWNQLTETDQTAICEHTSSASFKKGAHIHDGSSCTGAILVRKGVIRVYMLSEEGKEITLYRLFKGDLCILSASCVIKSITFDVFVDAEEDCECQILDGAVLSAIADRVAALKIFVLENAVSHFSDVMWVMQQILFMSFDRRLAIFLLDEMAQNHSDTVKLTHEQIAKYMGSAREVVSRMLKYFASEGIVRVSRGDIKILDKKKLRQLAQ